MYPSLTLLHLFYHNQQNEARISPDNETHVILPARNKTQEKACIYLSSTLLSRKAFCGINRPHIPAKDMQITRFEIPIASNSIIAKRPFYRLCVAESIDIVLHLWYPCRERVS